MLHALILDHDGTLVDSEPLHARAWSEALASFGVAFGFDEYVEVIGRSAQGTAERFVASYGLPESPLELLARKNRMLSTIVSTDGVPLMDGVRDLIDWAVEVGLRLGVSSGTFREDVELTLRLHGLEELVTAVSTQSDVENNKPAPDVYLRTLELLGVSAADALAIEDSATGIQSAKAAGLKTFAVRHHYVPIERLGSADACFDGFSDILRHLRQAHETGQ